MGEYSCDYLSHFCAGSKVVNMAGAGTSAYQWGDGAANTTLADTPANALAAAKVYLGSITHGARTYHACSHVPHARLACTRLPLRASAGCAVYIPLLGNDYFAPFMVLLATCTRQL